jgi:general secretion pathway protein E
LWNAVGCAECGGTGYRGRAAIGELLVIDEAMTALISARADHAALSDAARAGGMTTLRQSGLRMALDGGTSLGEVMRVVPAG